MQVKMLRFLQEGTYMPVGGRTTMRSEVRVVAATHRDLESMVQAGQFREDLYYRLKGVVLRTPSLAERRPDVAALATRFAQQRAARLSAGALSWLVARDWPGNVRELKAVVESAAALLPKGQRDVDADLLSLAAGDAATNPMPGDPGAVDERSGLLERAVVELERRLISEAMHSAGGNQSEAARRLGVSRVGLIKKLARLGLR
jgi:two-component system NtrC family response regulator